MFAAAERRKLIAENHFTELTSAAIAANRERYVTPKETAAILDECPNDQWRLLFLLCRVAGLRCPSETHALTWADMDWEHKRMTVHDKKRKRVRVIPIFAQIMPYLERAFFDPD